MASSSKVDEHENNQVSILKELGSRFVLFPIKFASVFKMYKLAVSSFWTPEEIDISKDFEDWVKLSDNERTFLKNVLAFFAASDGIVNENLAIRFMNDVPHQEVKCFYAFQLFMENVHCVAGDTLILTDGGHIEIQKVVGKMIDIWNGECFSNVMIMKTSDSAPACTVHLSNGKQLTCTPNHKWIIADGSRVETLDLQEGVELATTTFPQKDERLLNDPLIFSRVEEHGRQAFSKETRSSYCPPHFNCRPHLYVPLNYSHDTMRKWFDGARSAQDLGETQLLHDDDEFLKYVQLLLDDIGISSTRTKGAIRYSPPIPKGVIRSPVPLPVTVLRIDLLPYPMPMYCFEEPKRNMGVFNGILTGQSETYSLLLDTYIKDPTEKAHLLDAIHTIPCIKKKAEWAMKWITDKDSTFAKRLIAFAVVEGIFFSGAFCAIFWMKERGVLPGLCLSNEFISRDESLHTEFAIHLHSLLAPDERLDAASIKELVAEAVIIEDEFINESISCNMLGMNTDLMSTYIKFVADRLIVQLGFEPLYHSKNPFPFMDRISLSSKSNFFEHTRQSEYARARVGGEEGGKGDTFALDADF